VYKKHVDHINALSVSVSVSVSVRLCVCVCVCVCVSVSVCITALAHRTAVIHCVALKFCSQRTGGRIHHVTRDVGMGDEHFLIHSYTLAQHTPSGIILPLLPPRPPPHTHTHTHTHTGL